MGRRAGFKAASLVLSRRLQNIHRSSTDVDGGETMAVVETERHGQILVVRMNRPERLNALNLELQTKLAETRTNFRESDDLEVAVFTGTGRAFCAGEDMKESLEDGAPGQG